MKQPEHLGFLKLLLKYLVQGFQKLKIIPRALWQFLRRVFWRSTETTDIELVVVPVKKDPILPSLHFFPAPPYS